MSSKTIRLVALIATFSSFANCYDVMPDWSPIRQLVEEGLLDRMAEVYKGSGSYDASQCANDILQWAENPTELWAWSMFDAMGKLPHGILTGNVFSYGQYDQCLAISHKNKGDGRYIKGKYCPIKVAVTNITMGAINLTLSYLYPPNQQDDRSVVSTVAGMLAFTWGVCIPHTCVAAEVEEVLKTILKTLDPRTLIRVNEEACSVDEPTEWEALEISAVVVFGCFAALMLCSTSYDLYVKFCSTSKTPKHDLLIAFSMYTNTEKLFKINKTSNSLRCLFGLRTLSMFWVILGHRYSDFIGYRLQNFLDVFDWSQTYPAMLIFGGEVAVDTFFFLSGLLLAYLSLKSIEKDRKFNLGMFYIHRFLRLWPAMAAYLYFNLSLMKYMADGPMWKERFGSKDIGCSETWWATLLFIQNYMDPNKQCGGHLWYLAIDTQLYVLSPILLLPFLKFKKAALANVIFWILTTQACIITMSYTHKWHMLLATDNSYWQLYYTATYTRGSVWMLGFLLGYFIYTTKNKQIKINKFAVAVLWLVSLAIMASVIFGVKPMVNPFRAATHLRDSTFHAFSRSAWVVSLGWIIFACLHGYGGPVNWFLSLTVWEILGRLSYSMYILHVAVQAIFNSSARVVPHFLNVSMVYAYFGDVVMIGLAAYVWAMAFEAPFLVIEKALLHKRKPAPTRKVDDVQSVAAN